MTDTDPASAVPSGAGSPKEDAATKSAREELKHTVISERQDTGNEDSNDNNDEHSSTRRAVTPDKHDALKEQVSSPKKKRAHDELDKDEDEAAEGKKKNKDAPSGGSGGAEAGKAVSAGASALGAPNGGASRADEPEKKRLRDEEVSADTSSSGTLSKEDKPAATAPASSAFASSGFAKLTSTASPFGNLAGGASGKPSLFGSSSGSASPFGALGGGASAATTTTSTSTSTTKPAAPPLASPPTLSFGGGGSASPFAGLPSSTSSTGGVFGSAFGGATAAGAGAGSTSSFGGGFGSGLSGGFGGGARSAFGAALSGPGGLSSFAKPGAAFKSDKPARPFGAPESDDAEESDDEDSAAEEDENGDEDKDEAGDVEGGDAEDQHTKSAPATATADLDKKKQKLQRVAVDDGEAGEATLLQVRARMYYLDKDLGGWKERGAGMLKINVPEHCVDFDSDGSVIPASFDASTLGEEEDASEADEEAASAVDSAADDDATNGKPRTGAAAHPRRTVVRLIMRQDSTHRVILNTAVLPSTEFKERQTLKATTVLFTAFEGSEAKPVSMQAKMSIPNAKALMAALDGIQKELRGD